MENNTFSAIIQAEELMIAYRHVLNELQANHASVEAYDSTRVRELERDLNAFPAALLIAQRHGNLALVRDLEQQMAQAKLELEMARTLRVQHLIQHQREILDLWGTFAHVASTSVLPGLRVVAA